MRNACIIFVFAVFDTLWHGWPKEILRDGERYYQQYFIICRSASESCTGWLSHSHTSSRSSSRLMEWVIVTSCSLSLAYISKRLLIGFKLVNTCGELQFLIVWAKKFMILFRNRTMGGGLLEWPEVLITIWVHKPLTNQKTQTVGIGQAWFSDKLWEMSVGCH